MVIINHQNFPMVLSDDVINEQTNRVMTAETSLTRSRVPVLSLSSGVTMTRVSRTRGAATGDMIVET